MHVPPPASSTKTPRACWSTSRQGGVSSRVWRFRPDRKGAEALILRTIKEARAADSTRLVWHTADGVSPPPMDDLLPQYGFAKTEDLDVLTFELGTQRDPKLPDLRVPAGVRAWLVCDEPDLHRANAVETAVFPASSWDSADTRAYLLRFSNLVPGQKLQGEAVSHSLRCLASVRNPENEGWEETRPLRAPRLLARRSACGAPRRSRGTGAAAPTPPS